MTVTLNKDALDAEFWKARASRLRWALVDIATGDHERQPITTLEQAQRIAHEAIEVEREETRREGRA